MDKEETLILTAYTGILMCPIDEFRMWLNEKSYTDPFMFPWNAKENFERLRTEVENDFIRITKKPWQCD